MTELARSINRPRRGRAAWVMAFVVACGASATAHAQLGTGWVETTFQKRVHLDDEAGLQTFTWTESRSVCSPMPCADYGYDAATGVETFRIFDSRSNRSEIRLSNEYSTGIRQFEGYVTFDAPLHDESLFQIFGNSRGSATYLMMRGYRDNGGEIRVMSPAQVIAAGVYGKEVRINIIHEQNVSARFYVNGKFVYEKPETDTVATNYWKYGCYGTTSGNVPAVVKWRAVRTFRDGRRPEAAGDAGTNGGGAADAAPRDGAADAPTADAASVTGDSRESDGPARVDGPAGPDGALPSNDGAMTADARAAAGSDASGSAGSGGSGGAGPGGAGAGGGGGGPGGEGGRGSGPGDASGGCSCRFGRDPGGSALLGVLPLLALGARRRRRRRLSTPAPRRRPRP